jgi:hypothetical protein
METSIRPGKRLLSRIGKLAIAIGFILVIGGVGVGPALAGGGGHDHGDNGRHRGWHHNERHDNNRYENHRRFENYYYARPNYYAPNYYDAPPPVYYEQPRRSQGWSFIFPF